MKGRPPKPPSIRELHGSKKRPYHGDAVEVPTVEEAKHVEAPDPPRDLDASERKYWRDYAPLLAGAKLLTPADRETLAAYCRCCAAVAHRGRLLRREFGRRQLDRSLIKTLDIQLRGWIEKQTNLAVQLGLTAISRTRVGWTGHKQVLDKKEKPKSALAELQQQAAEMRRPVAVK